MTRDDIIRMREQADDWTVQHLQCVGEYHPDFHTVSDERFAALVAAAEREACVKVAENGNFLHDDSPEAKFGKACAAAIRARGQA
jgi:hypothetical protein